MSSSPSPSGSSSGARSTCAKPPDAFSAIFARATSDSRTKRERRNSAARSDDSGSEFIVRLPVLDSPSRPEELVQRAHRKSGLAKSRSRRVLVVDDNPDAVETLSILLQLRHNDVLTAVDGLEAVEAAAAFQPDLILLDIGLPKLNGYEAARRIREQRQDQRVMIVAMTGWGQEEDRRKSKEAGFNQHLVKPVDPGLLEELLASAPILS